MRMNFTDIFSLIKLPLLILFLINLLKINLSSFGLYYIPWGLDYSLSLIAFFILSILSVMRFRKEYFSYTLVGAFLLSLINYPMIELMELALLQNPITFDVVVYLGDITLSVVMSLIFSVIVYKVSGNLKSKRR